MSTVTTPARPVKVRKFEPVSGVFSWKTAWDGTTGRLVISTRTGAAVYTVTAIRTGSCSPHFGGHLCGFELLNEGNGEVYHVALEAWGWDCDCWDGLIRQQHATTPQCRSCKHVKALQVALQGQQAA
jgi:hypothetical protein